jgi:hypothetical protein
MMAKDDDGRSVAKTAVTAVSACSRRGRGWIRRLGAPHAAHPSSNPVRRISTGDEAAAAAIGPLTHPGGASRYEDSGYDDDEGDVSDLQRLIFLAGMPYCRATKTFVGGSSIGASTSTSTTATTTTTPPTTTKTTRTTAREAQRLPPSGMKSARGEEVPRKQALHHSPIAVGHHGRAASLLVHQRSGVARSHHDDERLPTETNFPTETDDDADDEAPLRAMLDESDGPAGSAEPLPAVGGPPTMTLPTSSTNSASVDDADPRKRMLVHSPIAVRKRRAFRPLSCALVVSADKRGAGDGSRQHHQEMFQTDDGNNSGGLRGDVDLLPMQADAGIPRSMPAAVTAARGAGATEGSLRSGQRSNLDENREFLKANFHPLISAEGGNSHMCRICDRTVTCHRSKPVKDLQRHATTRPCLLRRAALRGPRGAARAVVFASTLVVTPGVLRTALLRRRTDRNHGRSRGSSTRRNMCCGVDDEVPELLRGRLH